MPDSSQFLLPLTGPGLVTTPITYCPGEWPHAHCPGCGSSRIVYGFDRERGGWVRSCDQCEERDETPKVLTCLYCGDPATLREHLIPSRLGGGLVVPGCLRCNREKLNLIPGMDLSVERRLLEALREEAARIQRVWWGLSLESHALWWLEVRRKLQEAPLLVGDYSDSG